MTIDDLKRAYDRIRPTTAINRARRAAIMSQILRLVQQGSQG